LGILTLDTRFPRIPGDVGNACTYDFPVRFKKIEGARGPRIISSERGTDRTLVEPFLDAAKELEAEGVRAITTTCGFLSIFQEEMSLAVGVPVFTSALLQAPMVSRMIGGKRAVGIVTANSQALNDEHLRGAGIDRSKMRIVVAGMEDAEEFPRAFLHDSGGLNVGKVEMETVEVCRKLVTSHREIGAVVFECTNLSPYSKAVQDEIGLPVFDFVSLANLLYYSVVRKEFKGFM